MIDTPESIDEAARLLVDARLNNRLLDELPVRIRPKTLEEAYAVQHRFIELLGWEVCGWFCACTNTTIQRMLGLDEPYYAQLLKDFIFESPATLASRDFPPIVLECEFGFRLHGDLPSRDRGYTRAEVEAVIETVHPVIEVVAGHLKNWPAQDVFSVIADNGTDGAIVYGEGVRTWRGLDLVNMTVRLEVNGAELRRGHGARVLGDPVDALVWLANARARDGDGLKRGHIHNTGTATDIVWIEPGDEALADFEGLGEVSLKLS